MFECIKKCFKSAEEEVAFEYPDFLDKKAMDVSGFEYYSWGKVKRDEFRYLFTYISDGNVSDFQEEDLNYIALYSKTLIFRISQELEKKYEDRPGDITDYNLYDLIEIILEIRRYKSLVD